MGKNYKGNHYKSNDDENTIMTYPVIKLIIVNDAHLQSMNDCSCYKGLTYLEIHAESIMNLIQPCNQYLYNICPSFCAFHLYPASWH